MVLFLSSLCWAFLNSPLQEDARIRSLAEGVSSSDIRIRARCERELIDLGTPARAEVEGLTRSSDSETRLRANRILKFLRWGLTSSEKHAIDALLRESGAPAIGDGILEGDGAGWIDDRLRARWLPLGRRPVRYLLDLHAGTRLENARRLLLRLAAISKDPAVLPVALEALKSPDAGTRACAATACGELGQASAMPQLALLLDDQASLGWERTVAYEAAEAMEAIVGFPIDLKTWVSLKFPSAADGNIHLDPKTVRAWWARNEDLAACDAWKARARLEARTLVDPAKEPEDRLRGCLLLMGIGDEDVLISETLFDLGRSLPEANKRPTSWHWALAFLARHPFSLKGRPAPAMERLVSDILTKEDRSGDWTTALGVAHFLASECRETLPSRDGCVFLPSLEAPLRRFLGSPDPLRRYLAAMALAFLGKKGVEGPILETLSVALDKDAPVDRAWLPAAALWTQGGWYRFEPMALVALERLQPPASRELMQRYLDAESPPLRLGACRVLASVGDESCLKVLEGVLGEHNDILHDGFSWRPDEQKAAAFRCFYRLRRPKAIEWFKKELSGDREFGYSHADMVEFLLQKKEPAALEYWVARHGLRRCSIRLEIAGTTPDFLLPTLIDLVARDIPNSREFLSWIASDPGLLKKPIGEIRSWWEGTKGTFKVDPAIVDQEP